MRREWAFLVVLLASTLWGGAARAGNEPAPAPSTPPPANTSGDGDRPLDLSIRSLSVSQPSFTDTGDLDRVKQLNGGGTSRWPSPTTPIARGVYISVSPACIPGVDEPFFPGARPSAVRRR